MAGKKTYLGVNVRAASESESKWFLANMNIAGYATENRCIVLNPYREFTSQERDSVCRNEAYRILMNTLNIVPNVTLTEAQINAFIGTAYEKNDSALKQTIIARLASGDPSAGRATAEQKGYAKCLGQFAVAWSQK